MTETHQLLQPIWSILSYISKGDWINPSLENFQLVWNLAKAEQTYPIPSHQSNPILSYPILSYPIHYPIPPILSYPIS